VIIVTSSQHLSSQNDNLFSRKPWSLLPARNIYRLRMTIYFQEGRDHCYQLATFLVSEW